MSSKFNVQIDACAPFDAGHAMHNQLIDTQASNRGNMEIWKCELIMQSKYMSLLHLYKLAPCVADMPYLLHEQDRKGPVQDRKGTVNESPWK